MDKLYKNFFPFIFWLSLKKKIYLFQYKSLRNINIFYFKISILPMRDRWVWTIPFGTPVVPLEYNSQAIESSSISICSGHSEMRTWWAKYSNLSWISLLNTSIEVSLYQFLFSSEGRQQMCSRKFFQWWRFLEQNLNRGCLQIFDPATVHLKLWIWDVFLELYFGCYL